MIRLLLSAGGVVALVIVVFAWACCVAASRADDALEHERAMADVRPGNLVPKEKP